MCGIAGLFHVSGAAEARLGCLKEMLARLRHRGPDEMGYYFDEVVALGNARLSIVDVAGGQQPVSDATGRYFIVFNGEVYNYVELAAELRSRGVRLASNCDTEVLLQAWLTWGAGALSRINGAFAFCLYDRVARTLVLARDRFGKRPLYYARIGDGLIFGSELKSFLAYEPFRFELDGERLASILRVWTPLDDDCGFASVSQVPAGSYVTVGDGAWRCVQYAPLRLDVAADVGDEREAAQRVRQALADSVRLRLRGDVEVATYLSGGLDSAIVATLVADQAAGRTKTFSIRFEDEEFDESSDQELVATRLGTDHQALHIGSREIVDAFPEALRHAEVPVFRTAFVPMFLLSQLVQRRGIKVVLTGEGADEGFLGYDIFKETLLRAAWSRDDVATRQQKLARLYPYLKQFDGTNQASLHGLFNQFSRDSSTPLFSHDLRFHNSQLSVRLLKARHDSLGRLQAQIAAAGDGYAALSSVQKAQWLEFKTLLVGYLLSTQGDRMALAHGVENRCPFLDPSVVALGCATNLRFDDGFDEKHILKQAFAGVLPERILRKPKQPYRAPDAAAFLRCRPDYLEAIRSPAELEKVGLLDAKLGAALIERLLAKPAEQISQAENQAFLFLLSVKLLHEQFVQRRQPRPAPIDSLLRRTIDGRASAAQTRASHDRAIAVS